MRVLVSVLLVVCPMALCAAEDRGAVALWHFDGNLQDASGNASHGKADTPRFVDGRRGQALACPDYTVQVPSQSHLQLFPGLVIDCWVFFDERPTGYVNIVKKDLEYLLRVDGEQEGGQFAFFVYLDGWEPRVRLGYSKARHWHHVVATWSGWELSLAVDGDRRTVRRMRPAVPTDNPIVIGGVPGKIDELKILNPKFMDRQWLAAETARVPDTARTTQATFGMGRGWAGWRSRRGAAVELRDRLAVGTFPDSAAVWVHPGLRIDTKDKPYVLVDLASPTAETASLAFWTDKGYGETPLHLWGADRTAIAKLAFHPHWGGTLKLLALSFPNGGPHQATIERVAVSGMADGKPFLYVRNLSPGRAILRAGREEKILAVVRNVGGPARHVEAALSVPPGVQVLSAGSRQTLGDMAPNTTELATWTVRAVRPVSGRVEVALSADGFGPCRRAIDVALKPSPNLPRATYVPRPVPAKTNYHVLMHYCPLWKFGTHYGWNKIELWPERKPAIGFYDEGTPEVADWHIKLAREHGIQAFIYCWYRKNLNPTIEQMIGHAIHDGMLKARYRDMFNFSIMWENGCAKGVKDRDDMMQNLFPFWMRHYFTHPSYLVIDNKPVLFVWRPERVSPQLGGAEATRETFDWMRAQCRREGFDGLWIIGCVGTANRSLLERMAKEGWDASSAYGMWGDRAKTVRTDLEGLVTVSHRYFLEGQKDVWLGKKRIGALPDLVDVMMGWDKRPWFGPRATFYTRDVSAVHFEAALREAKKLVDATPGAGLDRRVVVLDNWNEFGEGHYLEPCAGPGFGFVDAVRRVFCDDTTPHVDITPEDVGLELPDRVYRKYRQLMFSDGPAVKRRIVDGLVAWWAFDKDDEHIAFDSSACKFDAFKHGFQAVPGVKGRAFRCKNSCVSRETHEWLFPLTGLTVELWMKTDTPNQTDRWLVNTVGRADTGYRLGLVRGRVMWQVPVTPWSHALESPEPAPMGTWQHVVATYDNETMRLYVDGEEKASRRRGGAIRPSGCNLCVGTYSQATPHAAFDGVLDEVKIYARALSPQEVRRHFGQHGPGKTGRNAK